MKSNIAATAVGNKNIAMAWAGIDYGARQAGTTAVCLTEGSNLRLVSCEKGQDADVMIVDVIAHYHIQQVFLDAPLSLPGIYRGAGSDYFYRQGDKALGAMSPMFIGGLTARAMQLKANLEAQGCTVFETYPAGIVKKVLPPSSHYKKDIAAFMAALQHQVEGWHFPVAQTWHQVDACLAWYGGWRWQHGIAQRVGDAHEGEIIL